MRNVEFSWVPKDASPLLSILSICFIYWFDVWTSSYYTADDHVNCALVLKSMVMRGREITYKAMEKNKKLQQEIDTMNDELDHWCQQLTRRC